MLVRLALVTALVKSHVAERGGQDIRATAIHLHLSQAIPVAPPTALRRERNNSWLGKANLIRRYMRGVSVHKPSIQVMVLPGHEAPEPAFLFAATMSFGLPNRPAMHETQKPEPELVQCAQHNFPYEWWPVRHGLNHHAEHVGDLGGEFDVVAQIRFRLLAVCLPQFREGFAIAVFRAHPEVFRNAVQ